jgi:hypothetical protein
MTLSSTSSVPRAQLGGRRRGRSRSPFTRSSTTSTSLRAPSWTPPRSYTRTSRRIRIADGSCTRRSPDTPAPRAPW